MYALVADINVHLEKAGLHSNTRGGISPVRRNGGRMILSARVQPAGGSLAIRFTSLDLHTRKLTTRTRMLDVDRAGASWLVELPEPHRQKILELDRARRVLNTRYRVLVRRTEGPEAVRPGAGRTGSRTSVHWRRI